MANVSGKDENIRACVVNKIQIQRDFDPEHGVYRFL
jgi:hypothetical protein